MRRVRSLADPNGFEASSSDAEADELMIETPASPLQTQPTDGASDFELVLEHHIGASEVILDTADGICRCHLCVENNFICTDVLLTESAVSQF